MDNYSWRLYLSNTYVAIKITSYVLYLNLKFNISFNNKTGILNGMTESDVSSSDMKLPKNSKENRYYYKHREEILAKRQQKKEESPEYREKMRLREEKRQEREQMEKERTLKRELRREKITAMLTPSGAISS